MDEEMDSPDSKGEPLTNVPVMPADNVELM